MHRSTKPTTAAAGHPDHIPAPCGKPTCRCATGEPHESPALRFTEDGRTKTLTLTTAEVAQVTAALARYEKAKADLDAQAAEGIARLRGSRAPHGSTGR
jgi:hypothetical protein